ncbi:uncharacterized protein LOC111054816 [Nilaparvata lugens]|uniref:uncharacterized protein LOC111054816 n=1 Tax=Nilaparvata lugens TaxID=108931 RepID=UPI00193EB898|nr:uncharacterized protein LOC111054816 [Nilaparvata lugens]
MIGSPEGSKDLYSSNGWMNGELFLDTLKHIQVQKECSKSNPLVLILDDHEPHVGLDVVMYCRDNGIHLLTFHPHTTHRMQPLDTSVFGPFKRRLAAEYNIWLSENPGHTISIREIPKLSKKPFIESFTETNIKSGFRKAGIQPLNHHISTGEDFKGASVTDRQPSTSAYPDRSVPNGYIRFIEDSSVAPIARNNIAFRLNTNRLFRAQIGAEGYDLRVGSRWVSDIGTRESSVTCFQNSEVTYSKTYNTKFRVKVVMRNGDIKTHRMEHIRKYNRQDFYKFIKEEFLQCTGTATINGKKYDLNFLRILNEIEVYVPVHQVEFYDGIEIFEKVTSNITKSVRIREFKYLDPGNLNVLKYEGAIELPDSSTAPSWPEWRLVEVNVEDVFWRIGHFSGKKQPGLKEVTYNMMSITSFDEYNYKIQPYIFPASRKFYNVLLGARPVTTVGTSTDIVVCSRDDSTNYNWNPYFRLYEMPMVTSNTYFKNIHYCTFLDKKKEDYFVCRSTKSNTEFMRVERQFYLLHKTTYAANDYEIGGIRYHDTEKVWYEVKGIGQPVAIAVKEVLYYADGFNQKYEGDIILDDDDDYTGTQIKKSGTEEFKDVAEQLELNLEYLAEDIKYRTDWRLNYHETYVSDASVNLQIGSKWEKEHAYEKDLTCKEMAVSRGQFDAVFRTRIVQQGQDLNNQILFEEYFDSLKTESWKCTDPENVNDGGILRIMNHFAIKRHHCGQIGKLWHWDGVTVLLGDYVRGTSGCMEIVEVKYLDRDYNPIKFKGKLQLLRNDVAVPKKVSSIRLTDVARIEVHNQPQANMDSKIFMTEVSEIGMNMVVGSLQMDVIKMQKAQCSQVHSPDDATRKQHRTAVEVNPPNQSPGSVDIQPVVMTDEQFTHCFHQDLFEIWNCKQSANGGAGEVFQRVVNIISPTDKCPPARVYHHNGVTVQKTLDAVKIKEVKYIKGGSSARFEGFLDIVEVYHKTSDDDTLARSSVEITYTLDTPYLFYTKIKDIGVLLEVGSRWEKPWGNVDSSVLCRRKMNHEMRQDYNTKVYGNVEGLENVGQRRLEMTGDKFREYFDVLRQEVWECSLDESNLMEHRFLRVVNFNIALKNISRIYHPDGITVGTQVFPDDTKSVQIKEVKYVSEDGNTVYRYDGQIVLETVFSNRHTKLFQMPNPFRRFNVEMTPQGAVSDRRVKYWSVDILRVYALRLKTQLMEDNADNKITSEIAPALQYTTKHQIDIIHIAKGFDIKMKVGSKWERELQESSMTCILDKWNPTNKRQFLTEIYMYFGDDKYVLNYDTIQEYFIIRSIQVWICVSVHNTLLRVVTTLEGVTGVWMVLYRDGVKVIPKELSSGGQTVTIVETKYMDPKDFKVLKYTGELKLLTMKDLEKRKEEMKKTEIEAPRFQVVIFERMKKIGEMASNSYFKLWQFVRENLGRLKTAAATTGN